MTIVGFFQEKRPLKINKKAFNQTQLNTFAEKTTKEENLFLRKKQNLTDYRHFSIWW